MLHLKRAFILVLASMLPLLGACASSQHTPAPAPAREAPAAQTPPETSPSAPTAAESAAAESAAAAPAQPSAQPSTTAAGLSLEDAVPLDPAVLHGQLENGLSYYIRKNHKPENRALLRLVVNAGSILEDEDQRGLAHFVEHMAFNGTTHFEKQELVDYLERIGMRFGPDLNAYTSFDETVYMLEVPTDDPEILAQAFQILEDWAHGLSFDDDEIDKERGVVIEEWRQGRGASGRIRDQQLPVLFHDSRYAERVTIGDREILATAPHDVLRRFYHDWYRPELMAVVAVGDFDPAAMEAQLRRHFEGLRDPDATRERLEYPIPDHQQTLFSIATDPEATSINLTVGYKRPPIPNRTLGDLRRSLVDYIYHGMMNNRLGELTLRADPPFLFAGAGSGNLGRTKSIYQLSARVGDGGVLRALRTLLVEAKRVKQYGFSESELERSKVNILRSIERAYEERDKQESAAYVGQYVENFLEGDPAPSIELVRDLYQELIPSVTLEEINARADQWITDQNRVILLSGPDKADAGIPTEKDLLAVFDEVSNLAVTPWVDRTRDAPLVSELPKPGSIVSEERIDELGVTRWQLSNGVRVLLKPTDFKNDEILFSAYSPGGNSLVADADYFSAGLASGIVAQMGLGTFDRIELSKALTGKVASASSSIRELSEGLRGGASPKDLETMFQLIYLDFTGARRDPEAYEAYRKRLIGQLENVEASPGFAFNREWNHIAYGDHPRRLPFTSDRVEEVSLDRALAIYRERFADASDFVFTFVGNFDLDTMRPLVEQWLGGLPSLDRRETWRDVDAYAKPGVHTFEVHKGLEPKSSVQIVHYGFTDWDPLDDHLAASMAQALEIRLREVLREDLGGVYGVSVSSGIARWPRARYNSSIRFECDPERVAELIAAAKEEVERFKTEGPSVELVAKVQEAQRRSHERALEQNRFWLSAIEGHEINQLPLTDILDYDDLIEAVTVESLRDAARRYFDDSNLMQGVLYPE